MSKNRIDSWSNILTLMMAVIVVDNHVHKAEIETFLKGADLLAETLGIKTNLTRNVLGHWFQLKRDDITERMNDSLMDSFVVEHILALEAFPEKERLLMCLKQIAIADKNLHQTEESIIQLAAAYWGIPLSKLETETA